MPRGMEVMKKLNDWLRVTKTFESNLRSMTIVSAGRGKCRAELTVEPGQTNASGTLHGGMIATLVDCVSFYALASTAGFVSSVTTDLHISCLKPARPGDVIIIDGRVCRVGKHLSYLEVEILKKLDGDLIARGQQTVYTKVKKEGND